MGARDLARVFAAGRIAIGAGLLLAPRLTLGMWIGRPAADGATAPVARALGVREVVLGAMALHTLDRPQVAARWLRALAACDAVDLAATVAARRSLPRPRTRARHRAGEHRRRRPALGRRPARGRVIISGVEWHRGAPGAISALGAPRPGYDEVHRPHCRPTSAENVDQIP